MDTNLKREKLKRTTYEKQGLSLLLVRGDIYPALELGVALRGISAN